MQLLCWGDASDSASHEIDRVNQPPTTDLLKPVAKSFDAEARHGQRVTVPSQIKNTRDSEKIGQDQTEQVQGMALDVSPKECQVSNDGCCWRDVDLADLFQGVQGRNFVDRRADAADSTDHLRDFLPIPAEQQGFKQTWRFIEIDLDGFEAALLMFQDDPAMSFDPGERLKDLFSHVCPLKNALTVT